MLDQSTLARPAAPTAPLLGGASRPLTFRIHSGSHRGREFQIRAAKCTIGSAAGCTLRLRASGVRPLHCWILRGQAGMVIRRRATGALLNGQAYEDAPLRLHDRLRIGSVELEVVECEATAAAPQSAFAPVTPRSPEEPRLDHLEKVQELQACLTAANEEIARLEIDAQQAWQTSITAAERAEQLRVALEQAHVEAGEARGELETAQAALRAEREGRQPQLESVQQQLAEAKQKLATSAETLARREREWDDRASQAFNEREALDTRVRQLLTELAQVRASAGQQTSNMTIRMEQLRSTMPSDQAVDWQERYAAVETELQLVRADAAAARQDRDFANQWEPRFHEAEQQLERWQAESHGRQTQIEELQQQLAESGARMAAFEAELQQARAEIATAGQDREFTSQWEPRYHEANRELEQLQAQVQVQKSQIEELQRHLAEVQSREGAQSSAAAGQLAEQQRELDQQREALTAREKQVNAAHRSLVEFEAELKSGSAALESERIAQQAVLDEQAAHLHEREQQLSQTSELAARQAELDHSREQLAEAVAGCEARQVQLFVSEAELASNRQQLAEEQNSLQRERDEFQREREELRRMAEELQASAAPAEQGDQSRDQEQASPGDGGPGIAAPAEASRPAAVNEPKGPASGPAPGAGVAANYDAQHEESVESYMDRLMKRSRGDGDSPPSTATVVRLRAQSSRPAKEPSEAKDSAEAHGEGTNASLAGKEGTDQPAAAAAGEAASSTAQTLSQNNHRKSQSAAAGRLMGAGILLPGSALLAYWAWEAHSLPAAVGAGIALLTGALWAMRGFGRMFSSLRLLRP